MMSQSNDSVERCMHRCIFDSCLPIPTDECHQRCRKRCDADDKRRTQIPFGEFLRTLKSLSLSRSAQPHMPERGR
jgi:hypothetical protein